MHYNDKKQWQIICNKKSKPLVRHSVHALDACAGYSISTYSAKSNQIAHTITVETRHIHAEKLYALLTGRIPDFTDAPTGMKQLLNVPQYCTEPDE